MKKFAKYHLEYPLGAIIAKVNLSDCIKVDEEFRKTLSEKNSFVYSSIIKHSEWEGYAFKMDKVEKIEPIQVNGKLSLWDYDYEEEPKYESL